MSRTISHGVDIIDLDDFKLMVEDADAMKRCFTSQELWDIGNDARSLAKAAGRFAAKEAVLKSLGEGWGDGISWKDVEVRTAENGAPEIAVYRRVASIAEIQGIDGWLVSISHSGLSAMASVIAIGKGH